MVKSFKSARSISMADARIVAMIVARFLPLSIARARWRLARPTGAPAHDCPQDREKLAYLAQERWLALFAV